MFAPDISFNKILLIAELKCAGLGLVDINFVTVHFRTVRILELESKKQENKNTVATLIFYPSLTPVVITDQRSGQSPLVLHLPLHPHILYSLVTLTVKWTTHSVSWMSL